MLIGLALNQYFNSKLSNLLFKDAYKYFYNFFESPGLKYKNLSE